MFEVPGEYKVRDESDAAITEFSEKYENALGPLLHWYHLAKRAQWTSLAEVRKDFRHADVVGVFTVFNIAGMETNIGSSPRSNTVGRCSTSGNIRYVLTHGEYDKEKWNRSMNANTRGSWERRCLSWFGPNENTDDCCAARSN